MRSKQRRLDCDNRICGRNDSRKVFSVFTPDNSCAYTAFAYLHRLTKFLVTEGENGMKVVVVRSPKIFSGVLRLIFGIKRQEQTT